MGTKYLIVGQGIAGTLIAWELLKREADVRVISSPNTPSSSEIAGGLINPIVFRTFKLSWKANEFLPQCDQTYAELEELLGEQFYIQTTSIKKLTHDEIEKVEAICDKEIVHFLSVPNRNHLVNGINTPIQTVSIINSGYLKGHELLKRFRRFLNENNRLEEREFEHGQLIYKQNGISYNGVDYDKVVFCEGANAVSNPWLSSLPFTCNKGEILEIYAPELQQDCILRGDVFILPIGNDNYKVGATYSRNPVDWSPSESGLRVLLDRLTHLIDVPFEVTKHYAGVRPALRDRKPILGPLKTHRNIIVFNGLGSRGFMMAPFWAKHLADYLTEKNYPIDASVNVNRFEK